MYVEVSSMYVEVSSMYVEVSSVYVEVYKQVFGLLQFHNEFVQKYLLPNSTTALNTYIHTQHTHCIEWDIYVKGVEQILTMKTTKC